MIKNNDLNALCDIFEQASLKNSFAGVLAFPQGMKQTILQIADQCYQEYKSTKSTKNITSFAFYMKVSLNDLPNNYPDEIRNKEDKIKLIIYILALNGTPPKLEGVFDFETKTLALLLQDEGQKYNRSRVEDLIEHELTHMVQMYLMQILHYKTKPGLPAEQIPKENAFDSEYEDDYYTSGIEFFPYVTNEISRFKKSPNKTKNDLLLQLDNSKFMKALYKKDPKLYQRAVKEIWKQADQLINRDPNKENSPK